MHTNSVLCDGYYKRMLFWFQQGNSFLNYIARFLK